MDEEIDDLLGLRWVCGLTRRAAMRQSKSTSTLPRSKTMRRRLVGWVVMRVRAEFTTAIDGVGDGQFVGEFESGAAGRPWASR